MLARLMNILGFQIDATDGTIGEVHGFYFDETTWTVRYMVADTGRWLPGKRVLIAPEAFGTPNASVRSFSVNLTRDQVRESPDRSTDLPVSRQWESDLFRHYGWTPYWELIPSGAWPLPLAPEVPSAPDGSSASAHERGDPHLRSVREVRGYTIAGSDNGVGDVTDFVAATDQWRIMYVVVDTGKWLPGRRVLLPTNWIDAIDWPREEMVTHLQGQRIKDSPEFDPADPITRDYEARLYEHYGRTPYWMA